MHLPRTWVSVCRHPHTAAHRSSQTHRRPSLPAHKPDGPLDASGEFTHHNLAERTDSLACRCSQHMDGAVLRLKLAAFALCACLAVECRLPGVLFQQAEVCTEASNLSFKGPCKPHAARAAACPCAIGLRLLRLANVLQHYVPEHALFSHVAEPPGCSAVDRAALTDRIATPTDAGSLSYLAQAPHLLAVGAAAGAGREQQRQQQVSWRRPQAQNSGAWPAAAVHAPRSSP
jgi:hypothetical protein